MELSNKKLAQDPDPHREGISQEYAENGRG